MAAFDFPSSPQYLQEYTPDGTELTYVWNGYAWVVKSGGTNLDDYLPLIGGNMSGNITFGPGGNSSKLVITNATGALTAGSGEPLRLVSNKASDGYSFANPSGSFNASVSAENLTANRSFKFPDEGGTFALAENFPPSVRFLGDIDVTGTAPTTPVAGDIYLNNTAGNAGASWTGLNEQFIADNQLVFYTALEDWVAGGVTDAGQVVTLTTDQTITGQKSFTKSISIGGTLPASPNITLSADGSGKFASYVWVDRDIAASETALLIQTENNSGRVFEVATSGTTRIGGTMPSAPNIELNADGSADFAGDVLTTQRILAGSNGYGATGISLNSSVGSIYCRPANTDTVAYSVYSGTGGQISDVEFQINGDGTLTIGNPTDAEIALNADGSGEFSNDVLVGGNANNGLQNGARLFASGAIKCSAGSSDVLWTGYTTGDTTATSTIKGDGSATFGDYVIAEGFNASPLSGGQGLTIHNPDTNKTVIELRANGMMGMGGTLPDTPLINLDGSDGSATFAGNVTVSSAGDPQAAANAGSQVLQAGGFLCTHGTTTAQLYRGYIQGNATPTFEVLANGNANFAGSVTTDKYFISHNDDPAVGACYLFDTSDSRTNNVALEISPTDSSSNATTRLNYDGSAEFSGVGTFDLDANTATALRIQHAGSPVTYFRNDGVAVFSDILSIGEDLQNPSPGCNIAFNSNGSAVFKEEVQAQTVGDVGDKTTDGIAAGMFPSGLFRAKRRGNTANPSTVATFETFFGGQTSTDNDNRTSAIFLDGSASFAKRVSVGSPTLQDDHSISAVNNAPGLAPIVSVQYDTNGSVFQGRNGAVDDNVTTAQINADGSAVFDSRISGTVKSIPDGAWDMADSNYWTTASATIVNPSSTEPGQCGVIYSTAEISGWGSYFQFPGGDVPSVPANSVIPYFVTSQNVISMGTPTESIS